ncbi:MAG TPA: hypothetical protein VLE93_02330 [Candidatus Saccharimonadales bacterium]|nr:hypothetical protein [Candidatus Saccharimonadales bacterium]
MTQTENTFSVVKLHSTERPADRFIGAETEQLIASGQEVLLVSLVEINNRWQTAIDLGKTIHSAFVKSYKESTQRSLLTKFESALKTLNQLLDDAEAKATEPVHCALGVFSGGQLYFSTINYGHILLWRRQKLSQISGAHLAGERFASVTSGDIKKDDWLIFGSQTLRELVKKNDGEGWETGDKKTLLKDIAESAEATDYPLLAAIAVAPSQLSQFETIKLDVSGAKPIVTISGILASLATAGQAIKTIFSRSVTAAKTRKKPAKPAEVKGSEPTDEGDQLQGELAAPTPKRRRFPVIPVLAGVVVLALLIAGGIIIRNEFRRVGKVPTVAASNISDLAAKTATKDMFAFIEQNLTVDNYKNLTAKQRAAFGQTLAAQNIGIVDQTAKAATLDNPIVAMDNTAGSLYLIDNTGQLWRQQTSTPTKVTQASLIANPVSLAALADNKILVADQAGAIWLFDGSASQPVNLTLPTTLTQGPKLLQKFGSSNLYIYQTSTGAIYKVGGFVHDIVPTGSTTTPGPDGTTPPPPPWVASSVLNFGTFDDWAVPGDFIGGVDSGVIKNFTKNKLENLSVQYYTDNTPLRLSLTATANQLAVARGKFVTIYSTTDGGKQSEKALVSDATITDLSPGPGGSLFVAAGKTLFKIP